MLFKLLLPFAFGYFLSFLYRVVNVAIAPDLVQEFGLDANQMGLISSAYLLTFALCQLPLGLLLDRYESRKVSAALLLIAAMGALVFASADSALGLLIGRGLIGIGVSACLMAAFTAYANLLPSEKLPLVNGLQSFSYTHLRAHETREELVCRLLLEKKNHTKQHTLRNV